MKFKKKTMMGISFVIGTIMFTTTAIAQVATKSGYDQLKDSVKYTAENCATKISNYTMDMSFIIKDNSKVIYSENSIDKVDVKNGAKESVSTGLHGITKTEGYNYNDKIGSIYKNDEQNVYYETEFTSPHENDAFSNPFEEDGVADLEKIADALVGNLKDSVVVTENADGTKILSGSLSESQIPALVDAVVSYYAKSQFGNNYNNPNKDSTMPKITKDVFVSEVKGNMTTNKDGFIQSVLGSGVISGKDESGTEHKLTFEMLVKITNVNSTKVSRPDLTGKKVEKSVEKDYSKLSNPEKYLGKYKTDILIEKEGKFVKIGEKFVDVTAIDDKGISGRHYEEYAKGYEEYATNKKDFKFDCKFENDQFNANFKVDDSSKNSVQGNISINTFSANIYFSTGENRSGSMMSDDQYNKVFN
ncbi:hypothetical protein [Clostridium sp.]|uniref:hypothetical protein n=1 Tax=Clostridium sp. TaxID=1506 RepID=UPI001A54A310|nr:hypothetical protein [Clostridium sp.]MBK5240889.1 hypothetical protein [Clostridium sp.]